MKAFCREKGLTLKENGKVIVTKGPEELEGLHQLKQRADSSGASARIIDTIELLEIEPYAATCEKALYSPDTAVIQPMEVLFALADEIERSGCAKLICGESFLRVDRDRVARTSNGSVSYEHFINAAGAFADKIAHLFGVGLEYKILPFKGTYKCLRQPRRKLVRGSIYPVPDLRNPFLGVHFTRSADDRVYVGPTAIHAFGRENYCSFRGMGPETAVILYRDAVLLLKNSGFRSAALSEPKKVFKRFVYAEAKKLIPELQQQDLEDTDKVGIRAQLVHWPSKQLVTDFVMLRGDRSLHILNAISPAFTTSISFARRAVDTFIEQ